jgi:hypothetical protein
MSFFTVHFTRFIAPLYSILLESRSIADGVDVPASVVFQTQTEFRLPDRTTRQGGDNVRSCDDYVAGMIWDAEERYLASIATAVTSDVILMSWSWRSPMLTLQQPPKPSLIARRHRYDARPH